MAEGKGAEIEVEVIGLTITPEESADLTAPVTVALEFTPSEDIPHAVCMLHLVVDTSSASGATRHVLPVGSAFTAATAGKPCNVTVASGTLTAGDDVVLSDLSNTSVLRLSLFSLSAASGGSEGKEDELEAAVAATQSTESILDVNMMVEIEASATGSVLRSIFSPLG